VLLLPSTSDTDLLNARTVGEVVPCRGTIPVRPWVDDLPALPEAADVAVRWPLGAGRACDGSPAAYVGVACSGSGEIAPSLTVITRERCVP
jgi:hypothetical protein